LSNMLAILMIGSISVPNVAVIARFYHPYPDKRISYQRLYTLDWAGKNRRLLSLPGQDCQEVMWAGRRRLVYEVFIKNDPYTTSIWTVSLSDGKPRLLAKAGYIDKESAFESAKDGIPVVYINRNRPLTVSPTSGRLRPLALRANGWHDPFKGADGAFTAKTISSNDKANPGSFSVNDENMAYLETAKGREVMEMPVWFGIHDPKSNRLWVLDYPSMHSERLHRVRWDTGKVQRLFWAGYTLDWRPDRQQVVYATQRGLSPYGPHKTVWTNELWIGSLESGAQRQLKLPMAWYADAVVSPPR
jgi:hypothetical protein